MYVTKGLIPSWEMAGHFSAVNISGLGELDKYLDKKHRSSKQSTDLLKVEYTPIDGSRPE
jgi:hypothetical protein